MLKCHGEVRFVLAVLNNDKYGGSSVVPGLGNGDVNSIR